MCSCEGLCTLLSLVGGRAAAIHRCTAIFSVTIQISIFEWDIAVSQNNKIFLIKIRNYFTNIQKFCFNQFNDSLPKYKPFISHRASSLFSIASHAFDHVFFKMAS